MSGTAMSIGLVILALPFVGLFYLFLHLVNKRRHFNMTRAHAVAQLGWYHVPPNPWLVEVAANLYTRGRAGEMVAGDFRGRGMCALDYTYTTSNGKTTTTHEVNLIALNLPLALPPLTVTNESQLKRLFSGPDLELESKAFNEAFHVTSPDPRFASAVLHPRMMEWLLFNPALHWQIAGNALVSWGSGPWEPGDVIARLEAMNRLIDLIPPFVITDYGRPVP